MRRSVPIWVYPTSLLVIGFTCGFGMSRVEVGSESPFSRFTYGGDADAARSILSNVLGGIISITTLTLTITIVTLQLASSQYSPRLMKRYLRDPSIQLAVAFFFFVFAFTIPVLFHVRSGNDETAESVPALALSIVIVLAVLMLVGLVYFVYHVTRSVRVENVLEQIAQGANRVLHDYPGPGWHQDRPPVPDDASVLLATDSGFLVAVDVQAIEQRLGTGEQIWLDGGIGTYVIESAPLARYSGKRNTDDITAIVSDAVSLGPERDDQREFAFGLREIVDIGVKALSPGINDPTTAIVSLHVATRTLASAAQVGTVDQAGAIDPLVVIPQTSWRELVFSTFDQFATYGAGDVQVMRALVGAIKQIIALAPEAAGTARLGDTLDSMEFHLSTASLADSERDAISEELTDARRLLRAQPSNGSNVRSTTPDDA